MTRPGLLPRLAPAAAAVATALLAAACGLGSSAAGNAPRASAPRAPRTAAGKLVDVPASALRRDRAAVGHGATPIGQDATSALQVVRAVAAFVARHPEMAALGCDGAAAVDETAANRNPAERSRFPDLPDLVQCGALAVAVLPVTADFDPAFFVLTTCAGSTRAPLSTVPTIGGANWVIWPWYGNRWWVAPGMAGRLVAFLGLSGALQPYTLSLQQGGGVAGSGGCYALRGFVPPVHEASPGR